VLAGTDDSLHGAGLFTKKESSVLWKRIRDLGILTLKSTPRAKKGTELRWEVNVTLGHESNRFEVTTPINQRERRYWHIFSLIRSAVRKRAGPLPFRNVYFSQADTGWLHIRTIPVSRVFIDGVDTKLTTPIFGYKVSAGYRIVELRALRGGHRRAFRVHVKPQGHTQLNRDLR